MNTEKFKINLYNSLSDFSYAEDFTQATDYAMGYLNATIDSMYEVLEKLDMEQYIKCIDKLHEAKNEAIRVYCEEKGL